MIRRFVLALLALALATSAQAQPYRPGFAPGFRSGLRFLAPVPAFTLAQLPPAALAFDLDAASGVAQTLGAVSSWAAKAGTLTVGTATLGEQPTLVADAWAVGVPVVRFNGASSGNILRSSTGSFVGGRWTLFAAQRPAADQNAVATYKPIYETARLSDGLSTQLLMQRVTNDAAQSSVYVSSYGATTIGGVTGFAKGGRAILVDRADGRPAAGNRFAVINGTASTSASTTAGTTTRTQRKFGGSDDAVSARAAIDLARVIEIDTDQLPGKAEQVASLYLLEGHLAWTYGTQASLRADHPFFGRAPVAADYTGNNRLWQHWGTSICAGTALQLPAVLGSAAVGTTVANGCVGGTNSGQHLARFNANQDQVGGTSSGLPAADIRKKLTVFGDYFANDPAAGISWTDGKANLAGPLSAVETAQGYGVSKGHIIVWGYWRGSGNGPDTGLADADAKSAELQALYPAYFLDMGKELAKDAAPNGLMPDANAFARGVIPLGYRADSTDVLHLNAAGYTRAAQIEKAFAETRGWAQ